MSNPTPPEPLDLLSLVEPMLLGELDDAQAKALERWLGEDEANRVAFLNEVQLCRGIRRSLFAQAGSDALDDAWDESEMEMISPGTPAETSDVMSDVVDQALALRRQHEIEDEANQKLAAQQAEQALEDRYRLRRAQPAPVKRTIVIPKIVVWGSFAAVLFVGLALIGLNAGPGKTPATGTTQAPPAPDAPAAPDAAAPGPGPVRPAAPTAIATLTFTDQAVWSRSAAAPTRNARLAPGPITLESGVAHFVMDSGAVVMLKGPATIDLTSAWVAELAEGSAVARVPAQAQGFKVVGEGFVITDLGTEFAVRVDRDGMQCRVILGEVDLATPEQGGSGVAVQRLRENRLVSLDPATGVLGELDHADADDIAWALPYTAMLNQNLVVNGGFEDGEIGIAQSSGVVDNVTIPGWEDTNGPATVLNYEQAGTLGLGAFPVPETDPMPEGRGRGYFVGSEEGETAQTIDLAALGELADAGSARFVLSADLGGLTGQDDHVRVVLDFLDADGRVVGHAELEPVDAQVRKNRSGFLHRSHEGELPAGTRGARIRLIAVQTHGTLADAYADNIALVVKADTAAAGARTGDAQSSHLARASQTPPQNTKGGMSSMPTHRVFSPAPSRAGLTF